MIEIFILYSPFYLIKNALVFNVACQLFLKKGFWVTKVHKTKKSQYLIGFSIFLIFPMLSFHVEFNSMKKWGKCRNNWNNLTSINSAQFSLVVISIVQLLHFLLPSVKGKKDYYVIIELHTNKEVEKYRNESNSYENICLCSFNPY